MPAPHVLLLAAPLLACPVVAQAAPRMLTYKTVGGQQLKAHVFEPQLRSSAPRPAILLFHGGGWTHGNGTWVYTSARRFADLGMVAVAIDYRLSDEKTTTPLDAMEDAQDALRWVRAQQAQFHLDPRRVVAYGLSAGGHLAACLAMVHRGEAKPDPAATPDALILLSPAVAISNSTWARKLLLGRATPEDISPDQYVRPGLPPILINQGQEDTVTSFTGAVLFTRRMNAADNACELRRHSGLGHLLTRNLDEQEWTFDPDPVVRADVWRSEAAFLTRHGFLPAQPPAPDSPETAVRAFIEAVNARNFDTLLKQATPDVAWFRVDGEPGRPAAAGRGELRGYLERHFKAHPGVRADLHMVAVNGAFVSARERRVWKTPEGESRSQNALVTFEVQGGLVRRIWSFPVQ